MNIVFKGQRVDNEEWVEGYLVNSNKGFLIIENNIDYSIGTYIIKPESITCNIAKGLKRDIENIDTKLKEPGSYGYNNYQRAMLKAYKIKSKEILKRIEG